LSDNLAQSSDIYERLGVSKDTSGAEIHRHFIKLLMQLLQNKPTNEHLEEYLLELQNLWFAHDILVDPSTRTDYDLRALGIRTGEHLAIDEGQALGAGSGQEAPAPPSWRIGELLQAAGLLEQSELDIACDMHKAMPELQMGGFLVKQGFISERQLQAVLIGQILLRTGDLTLSQYCSMIKEVDQSRTDIKEILLEKGYINKAILAKLGT
jgi:curved DNA-binding protein CbpA